MADKLSSFDLWDDAFLKNGSDLTILLTDYLPNKDMGFIDKMTVQCLGILWCGGTKSEKANALLDLIYSNN